MANTRNPKDIYIENKSKVLAKFTKQMIENNLMSKNEERELLANINR